jgi:hypothetical protein
VAFGLIRRLGASGRELACLGGIVLLAAALRLVNLPLRGGWDADQGTEMLALRSAVATGHIPTFGPEAISVTSSFHHGALYYDLLLPAAWLGNGDPTWVVAEIALLSLLVIPIAWWIARSIGGPAAGLTTAALAATSASLISYSTFIWNPTLVEPGASIAFLGAWQAVRTRRPAWWVVSAVGAAVAVQANIAAAVIVLPLGAAFVLDLRRGPSTRVFRIGAWGAAGFALFALSYLPLIVRHAGLLRRSELHLLRRSPGAPAAGFDPDPRLADDAMADRGSRWGFPCGLRDGCGDCFWADLAPDDPRQDR